MSALKRHQSVDAVDSDDEELSEREEETLEEILVLFPARKRIEASEIIEDQTFDKVKNLLTCPICLEIFNDPVLVKKCLHRFCKQCIEKVIRSQINKSCPACRMPLGCKRILKSDEQTEKIIKRIFPNLKEYQQKEEAHQKIYYRSKTKELQDNSNPLKRRRRDLEPVRRMTSTPVPVTKEPIEEKKKEPEVKKAPEVKEVKEPKEPKEKKPKKQKLKQKEKKALKRGDADITILDIDPDKVIEIIIEDNENESDGIVILDDEPPQAFATKKKKPNTEQEVILIDESTDCEEIKEEKKPQKVHPPLMPLHAIKKPEMPFMPHVDPKDFLAMNALGGFYLQMEMLNPFVMPALMQEAALRAYDPMNINNSLMPLLGFDKTGGNFADQSFLKEIDLAKVFPKKGIEKELNVKELFNWTHPFALFGQSMDPFAMMAPGMAQLARQNKPAKDEKIIELK